MLYNLPDNCYSSSSNICLMVTPWKLFICIFKFATFYFLSLKKSISQHHVQLCIYWKYVYKKFWILNILENAASWILECSESYLNLLSVGEPKVNHKHTSNTFSCHFIKLLIRLVCNIFDFIFTFTAFTIFIVVPFSIQNELRFIYICTFYYNRNVFCRV